jgi:hypothetical protein
VQRVEEVFVEGIAACPRSAQLHVFVAQFVRYYLSNQELELAHLSAAEVCGARHCSRRALSVPPSVGASTVASVLCVPQTFNPDVALTFLLYQRRRQILQDSGAMSTELSVMDRISLAKFKAVSQEHTLRARSKQVLTKASWRWHADDVMSRSLWLSTGLFASIIV